MDFLPKSIKKKRIFIIVQVISGCMSTLVSGEVWRNGACRHGQAALDKNYLFEALTYV